MDERRIHAPCNWLTLIGNPSDGVVFVHHTFLLEAVAKNTIQSVAGCSLEAQRHADGGRWSPLGKYTPQLSSGR